MAHPDDLTACFTHLDKHGVVHSAVRTLAAVGDGESARLLSALVDDAGLGAVVASAIREIHGRR